MTEFWGKVGAYEAAQFFKTLAFDNNLIEKLYSMVHKDNLPSKKVAQRNGMTLEGKTTIWILPVKLYTTNNSKNDI